MVNLIPTYKCFYKEPGKNGWSLMIGDNIAGNTEDQFRKAKEEGKILDYKFFNAGQRNSDFPRDHVTEYLSYRICHEEEWRYSPDTNLWHRENEYFPEPNKISEISSVFQIDYEIVDFDEFRKDVKEDSEDLFLLLSLTFKSCEHKISLSIDYFALLEYLKAFINEAEKGNNTFLAIDDFSENILHIWQKEDENIRFAIQSLSYPDLNIKFDVTISRELFLRQFNIFLSKLDSLLTGLMINSSN